MTRTKELETSEILKHKNCLERNVLSDTKQAQDVLPYLNDTFLQCNGSLSNHHLWLNTVRVSYGCWCFACEFVWQWEGHAYAWLDCFAVVILLLFLQSVVLWWNSLNIVLFFPSAFPSMLMVFFSGRISVLAVCGLSFCPHFQTWYCSCAV